jgi:hypothetical protein
MIKTYDRGNVIVANDYEELKRKLSKLRRCIRCKKYPTKEGYDACLGHIDNVISACCGHGIMGPMLIKKSNY